MLTRLTVLGMLMRRPLSGYEIQLILHLNRSEQWASILPGSIYHALKKLAGEGLVVLQSIEQAGNRTKAIYAITPQGEEEFRRLLRDSWRTPVLHFPSGIYVALGFLDDLPREEVVQAIDAQIAALEGELAAWNAGELVKAEMISQLSQSVPEYQQALFANGREHMELDLRLLRHLRETLPSVPRFSLVFPPLEEENS